MNVVAMTPAAAGYKTYLVKCTTGRTLKIQAKCYMLSGSNTYIFFKEPEEVLWKAINKGNCLSPVFELHRREVISIELAGSVVEIPGPRAPARKRTT